MPALFDSLALKGLSMRNRTIRSATWEGMCDPEGRPTQKLTDCYVALAEGGIGLIVTGYTYVRPDGKQMPGKMGIHTDDFASDYRAMVQAVHDAGAPIAIQLVHAGGQTSPQAAGTQPVAPSAVAAAQYQGVTPRELSAGEIGELVTCFASAAARAKQYGFDAVQLHGAHGYLINQFLSPHTNLRKDEFGGSLDNRMRFLMNVYSAVREAVGADYPVMIKLTGTDNLQEGLSMQEAVTVARALGSAGIDAIEVSGGTPASGEEGPVRGKINKPDLEGYNLTAGSAIKQAVACPVFSVGGFRSYERCVNAMQQGMDGVALSRPLIREPGLVRRWQSGDTAKATCISCNKCFVLGIKEGGIACAVERKKKEEQAQQ